MFGVIFEIVTVNICTSRWRHIRVNVRLACVEWLLETTTMVEAHADLVWAIHDEQTDVVWLNPLSKDKLFPSMGEVQAACNLMHRDHEGHGGVAEEVDRGEEVLAIGVPKSTRKCL